VFSPAEDRAEKARNKLSQKPMLRTGVELPQKIRVKMSPRMMKYV
jgi:hypothetical protein